MTHELTNCTHLRCMAAAIIPDTKEERAALSSWPRYLLHFQEISNAQYCMYMNNRIRFQHHLGGREAWYMHAGMKVDTVREMVREGE